MAGTGDLDALKALRESRDVMRKEIGKVIVGQDKVIESGNGVSKAQSEKRR